MKRALFFLFSLLITLASCSHKISSNITNPYPPLDTQDDITIIGVNDPHPENYELVGQLKLGDTGFSSNCDYNDAIRIAKDEAQKSGGNAVKITQEILPSVFGSTCYRMNADIIKIDDLAYSQTVAEIDTLNSNANTSSSLSLKVPQENSKNKNGLTLSLKTGFSYRTAAVSEDLDPEFQDYLNKLKSGFHLGADLNYYFSDSYGLGLKYSLSSSSNSMDDVYINLNNGYGTQNGSISDKIKISFFGPTLATRTKFLNKHALVSNISIGYLGYKNESQVIDDYYTITGSTLGSAFEIGYNIPIAENTSIGFMISYFLGTLTQYDISDGTDTETVQLEKGEYESLNRFDFSVTLNFGK